MAWGNNNNNNNYGRNYGKNYSRDGGYQARNSGGYQSNGSYGSRQSYGNNRNQQKKHSGCTMSRYVPKDGPNKGNEQTIVNGWTAHKGAPLLSFTAVTTKNSVLSEKGWYGSVMVTVTNKKDMSKQMYWATMEAKTGKVVIGDLGLVMNPKGGRGGYVGTYINK